MDEQRKRELQELTAAKEAELKEAQETAKVELRSRLLEQRLNYEKKLSEERWTAMRALDAVSCVGYILCELQLAWATACVG